MSEYQYYEFQAIDRPLTESEQQAVAQLSSRVYPHPRRAVFTYSCSDFPARAEEILAKYYDAMLYLAWLKGLELAYDLDEDAPSRRCRPGWATLKGESETYLL